MMPKSVKRFSDNFMLWFLYTVILKDCRLVGQGYQVRLR